MCACVCVPAPDATSSEQRDSLSQSPRHGRATDHTLQFYSCPRTLGLYSGFGSGAHITPLAFEAKPQASARRGATLERSTFRIHARQVRLATRRRLGSSCRPVTLPLGISNETARSSVDAPSFGHGPVLIVMTLLASVHLNSDSRASEPASVVWQCACVCVSQTACVAIPVTSGYGDELLSSAAGTLTPSLTEVRNEAVPLFPQQFSSGFVRRGFFVMP